jgi:hypothetical protein
VKPYFITIAAALAVLWGLLWLMGSAERRDRRSCTMVHEEILRRANHLRNGIERFSG